MFFDNVNDTEQGIYDAVSKQDLKAIEQAKNLSDEEKHECEKHEKLYNLTLEDLAYNIRAKVKYYWLDFYIEQAIEWNSIRKGKYDKRRKYSEKDSFESITHSIQELFDDKSIEIVDLCSESYGCAYWITFTNSSDYVFHLRTPNIKNLRANNMQELNYGKISFGYYSSEHLIDTVSTSYLGSDLKDAMHEVLTSDAYKKHYSKAKRSSE